MDLLAGAYRFRPASPEAPNRSAARFKGLGPSGESTFGGQARWDLPDGEAPGEWLPPVAPLWPGATGYHLCGAGDLLRCWLAPRLFVAEGRGASLATPSGAAIAYEEARLVRELPWDQAVAARLYRDCLEQAVAEARRHDDYLDEHRHWRVLAGLEASCDEGRWPEVVRLGLAELAGAVGDLRHRAEWRRRDGARRPRTVHHALAQAEQVQRFLLALGELDPGDGAAALLGGAHVAPAAAWRPPPLARTAVERSTPSGAQWLIGARRSCA